MEENSEHLTIKERQTLYINAIKLLNDGVNELEKIHANNVRRQETASGFPKEILSIISNESKSNIDTVNKLIDKLLREMR
jgi:hypothetical protein